MGDGEAYAETAGGLPNGAPGRVCPGEGRLGTSRCYQRESKSGQKGRSGTGAAGGLAEYGSEAAASVARRKWRWLRNAVFPDRRDTGLRAEPGFEIFFSGRNSWLIGREEDF